MPFGVDQNRYFELKLFCSKEDGTSIRVYTISYILLKDWVTIREYTIFNGLVLIFMHSKMHRQRSIETIAVTSHACRNETGGSGINDAMHITFRVLENSSGWPKGRIIIVAGRPVRIS